MGTQNKVKTEYFCLMSRGVKVFRYQTSQTSAIFSYFAAVQDSFKTPECKSIALFSHKVAAIHCRSKVEEAWVKPVVLHKLRQLNSVVSFSCDINMSYQPILVKNGWFMK